ncbi:MAG TPA: VapE domain-containing protein [Terriglobales bacterium]|jgi:hypothetical protein|nr:VapE domain-containing protein [Terriglobales bacterium]
MTSAITRTPLILPENQPVRVRTFGSPAEWANHYCGLGFKPVPVAHRGKNPKGNNWEDLRIDASRVNEHFNGQPLNIGVLLGIDGLTDADFDSVEALRLASVFMPNTGFSFGRLSKPASHWEYFVNPPVRLLQLRDPIMKTMLAELRGLKKNGEVGLQTVFPGSIHLSGESITCEPGHDSEPACVSAPDLISRFQKTVAAALLCRYWPAKGRHDTMLALAGTLARGGWTQDEALIFCRAVYQTVPTHDPGAISRIDSEISDSYAKVAAGEPATGFPELIKHIDKKVVETAFDWLKLKFVASAAVPAGEEWRKDLQISETGTIKPLLLNIVLMLRNDPKYQGLVAFNEFGLTTRIQRRMPWQTTTATIWTDYDDSQLTALLQQDGIAVNTRIVAEGVATIAQENPFHPVRDYLKSHVWDQTQRVDSLLPVYFGAEDTCYTRAVGKCWLISGVARIMMPGCKVDHILLLEGPQGSLKSTAVRTLAGDENFCDHISELGSKDSRLELAGTWIFELAELDRVRRGELSRVKAFVTAQTDVFRPPYGRRTQRFPRSCIFVATANDTNTLVDETGNRRWWPIRCGRIDIEALARDRDQLWAEALALFEAGEKWWLTSPELNNAAAREADERYQPGIWDEEILNWCERPEPREKRADDHTEGSLPFDSKPFKVTIADVLLHCIGKPFDKMVYADLMQVQRCLVHNGWKRLTQVRVPGTGRRARFYQLPTPVESSRGTL